MASGTFVSIVVVFFGIIFPVWGQEISGPSDVAKRLDHLELILTKRFDSIDAQLKTLQLQLTKLTEERERDVIVRDIISAINRGHVSFVDETLLKMGDRAPISDIVYQVYGGSESNFDLLTNLTQSLMNVAPSCQILSTLYDEMKRNDHLKNIKHLSTLAKAFESCRINSTNASPDAFKSIEDDIEKVIVSRASELLIAALESKKNYKYNEVAVETLQILDVYRPDVGATVMERTVDGVFKSVDQKKILKAINTHTNLWQQIAGMNVFFRQLKAAGPLQNSMVMTILSYLSEIRKQPEYAALDFKMRGTAEALMASLPACARNLLLLPSFCIYNDFQNSYLATTNSVYNRDRRYVYTLRHWGQEQRPSGISWRVKISNNKLFFDNADFPGEYIFTAGTSYNLRTHYVFAWIPNTTDVQPQSSWSFDLDGDNCYLKNDDFQEYLFASEDDSDDEDNSDGNYLYALSMAKEDAPDDSPFIWQIKEC